MVFSVMKAMKRFYFMTKFDNDNEIESKLKTAKDYNKLLKEIPVQQMLEVEKIEDMSKNVTQVFA